MHCALKMPVLKCSCNFEEIASCFTPVESVKTCVEKTFVPLVAYNTLHGKI